MSFWMPNTTSFNLLRWSQGSLRVTALRISPLAIRIRQTIRSISICIMYALRRSTGSRRRFQLWVDRDILAWGRTFASDTTLQGIIHFVPIIRFDEPWSFVHAHVV